MNEVRSQPLLRVYGSVLALTHLFTVYFWLDPSLRGIGFFTDALPVCWPYLNGCEDWPRLNVNALFALSFVYAMLAAASAVLFYFPKHARTAFWLLAGATLIKFGMYQLDYRLSGNYHYMHFWVLAAFLLLPAKSLTIRFLLVGFYLGAGILKLNREWLSGSAIWENQFLTGEWLKAGCAYVVVLELVLIFGLFSRRRWIFWMTFGQLILFHAVSYLVVGYYYPLMLLSLLSIFVLAERETPGGLRLGSWRALPVPARIFLSLFVLCQLLPFVLGKDRALDVRGRLFSLSLFDARAECEFKATSKFKDPTGKIYEGHLLRQYILDHRLHCDPNILLADARHRCRSFSKYPEFVGLDVSLKSKRKSDSEYTEIFTIPDFCAKPHDIDVWGRIH